MGMGLMDLLAAAQGGGGGMGMMGLMPQTAAPSAPVGKSVVKALLAKHGSATGAPVAVPSAIDKPALPTTANMTPAPVALSAAPIAPDANAGGALAAAGSPSTIKGPGMLSRIGDYLKSDEGRATMMRFAAGAFNGGIGGGLDAATRYADQRKADQAAATAEAEKLAMQGRAIDNTYNLGLGRLDIDAANSGETSRHNRAEEGNTAYGIDSANRRTMMETGEKRFEHVTPSGDTQVTQAGENYRHDNVSGDTTATQAGENYRHGTPSGDKTLEIQAQTAPRVNVHAHYTTTPDEYAANGPRLKPSMVKPNMPAGGATGGPEVRYDGNGQAYTQGPNGQAVRAPQFDRR